MMANMSLQVQIIILLSATALALRPAHFARQFETCGVACGGGWCCAQFESCVASPADTVDGGWGCIFQGASNDDGSPITDVPFNPSADAAVFNSISDFVSQQSSFISSLTSALSITSLSMQSITSLPSSGFTAPTVASSTSPTPPGPAITSGAAPTAPAPSSTGTSVPEAPTTSSPGSSPSSILSSSKAITTSIKASGSSSPSSSATTTPSIVSTSDTNSRCFGNGNIAALMFSGIAAAVVTYLT